MNTKMQKRLDELKAELAQGDQMLADLDRKRAELQHTLTRIAGAVSVLEELLASESGDSAPP